MTQALVETMKQEQLYWYDHPIQVGTPVEANEVIYGLKGLNEAVAFEKEEGHVKADEKVSVLLSLSVTHQGLRSLGRRYLEVELKKAGMLEHLQVYIVTEKDTERLFHEVLIPAMEILGIEGEKDTMLQVFGVDGEYGRHYTFLKFVSLVWRDFISQSLKATFKIDLDQVFPQEVLVKETGKTAFQHLQTPLWGAVGIDSHGKRIYCGLIAGALVNQADIHRGLFSPDVPFKEKQPLADELFFNSSLPQALSTEGEMMTQYKEGTDIDGRKSALQRIHVTGGTNGILVDALERYRPFTPSVIGRAEDQAFILSVLQDEVKDETLRYVHEPGLIMRHDKEAFAIAAITAAKTGKVIGDYIRILYFSSYASSLPRGMHSVKDEIDPFTGSFVTPHPVTTVALRLAWKSAALSRDNLPEGEKLLREGARRIGSALRFLRQSDNFTTVYQSEKKAWHAIYDVMKGIGLSDDSALRALADKGASIINNTRIKDE